MNGFVLWRNFFFSMDPERGKFVKGEELRDEGEGRCGW